MIEMNKQLSSVRIGMVIPVYNSERTLSSCIRSLLNQSFKPWEIIVVDASSQDGTKQIAEDFAKENPIIRYYDVGLKGRGISMQRNSGARLATGDFLLFVDSDWYLEQDALERLVKLIASGALCVGVSVKSKGWDEGFDYIMRCRQILWTYSLAQSYLNYLPYRSLIPYFIRRETFLHLGGFDVTLPALEDADLCVRLILNGVHSEGAVDIGFHDQVITLKTIVMRRIRSAHGARAFEKKWGNTAWGRRANVELKKRHNIIVRWFKGIIRIAGKRPRLLPGALLISIVDGISDVIAKVLLKFHDS